MAIKKIAVFRLPLQGYTPITSIRTMKVGGGSLSSSVPVPNMFPNGLDVEFDDAYAWQYYFSENPFGTPKWESNKLSIPKGLSTEYGNILAFAQANNIHVPSTSVQNLQNDLMNKLNTDGILDEIDSLFVFANDGNKEFGLIDWKKVKLATETDDSCTAIAKEGIEIGTYGINSNYHFPNDAVKMTTTDAAYDILIRQDATNTAPVYLNAKETNSGTTRLLLFKTSGNVQLNLMSNTIDIGHTFTKGFYQVLLKPDGTLEAFLDGTSIFTRSGITGVGPNSFVHIGELERANAAANVAANAVIAIVALGSSNEGKVALRRTHFEQYMNDLQNT